MPYTVIVPPTEPTPERMPVLLERYQADRASLERLYTAPFSPRRRECLRGFLAAWQEELDAMPFHAMGRSDQADWLLFANLLAAERLRLDREADQFAAMEPLIPFAASLIALEDDRRALADIDAAEIAGRIDQAVAAIAERRATLAAGDGGPGPAAGTRAAAATERIRKALEGWYGFYQGYDPTFTWWVERPYRALDQALNDYAAFLREHVAGIGRPDTIVGDPLGHDAIIQELHRALIPYGPEELVAIARREQAWCEGEARRAASEMGFGGDWRAALERVKDLHEPPGHQPALVRDLAREAIRFVEERDLVTVPDLAREGWRMEMMTPEQQKVNPFFLGGETIIVSFPTCTMEHAQKRMSLRGNNRHFSRATVQHELIPGHYLQMYSQERFRPYRRQFYTPFWVEGWTLHWEMLLWDQGFAVSPEDRLGMLFWRMHRCARVVFSLGFHLGQMTAEQCVDMLVDDYGHEPDNAAAEVRRSFGGDYEPLYQCAYLVGGLQVRALCGEMVGSGRMTYRQFHDAFLRENCMPIAVLRALLTGQPIERSGVPPWRFADG